VYRLEWQYHSLYGRHRLHERTSSKNDHEEIEDSHILSLLLLYLKYIIRSTCLASHHHDETDPQRFQIQIYEVSQYKSRLFFDLSDLGGPYIFNPRVFGFAIAVVVAATVLLHAFERHSSKHMMLHLRNC
jgi:hypothetical protein